MSEKSKALVERVRKLLRERVEEIDAERDQLGRALSELSGQAEPEPSPSSPQMPRKRARRGERSKQLLTAVQEKPGISAAELAETLGISKANVYTLGSGLKKQGRLESAEGGYRIKSLTAIAP